MIHKRIHELRIANGWTQIQLAGKLNITKQTVSNWENDNIQPSIEMLIKLTEVFRVSSDYLLGLEPTTYIRTDGLPTDFVTHLTQIIEDYKAKS